MRRPTYLSSLIKSIFAIVVSIQPAIAVAPTTSELGSTAQAAHDVVASPRGPRAGTGVAIEQKCSSLNGA